MSNLMRYDLEHINVKHTRELVPSDVGDWVKFDDIKELRSSTDAQQLKPKMPSLSEVVTHVFLGRFIFGADKEEYKLVEDTYNYIARHFGH